MTALQIYNSLLQRGTLPALTLYGPAAGAPRLELSGAVLANHVAKAANLLSDEIMIDPGQDIKIDLPTHWRLLTWTLGSLLAGGHIADDGDVVVTTDPAASGDEIIVVSLGALDLSYRGELPGGVIDGNADVLSQADILLDGSSAGDSNVDELFQSVDTDAQPLLIVDPSPDKLVAVFLGATLAGKSLVVTDSANAAKAAEVEGAELYEA